MSKFEWRQLWATPEWKSLIIVLYLNLNESLSTLVSVSESWEWDEVTGWGNKLGRTNFGRANFGRGQYLANKLNN
jgi:hypothetical protein